MTGQRVLLVDDEQDAVDFLREVLEDNGFVVDSASNAHDGLQQAHQRAPDLICLDVLMPGESGMSLYQKLRTDPSLKNTPVLITSAMSLSRDLGQIDYQHLADGTVIPEPEAVVEKPIDADRFIAIVAKVLG